MILQHTQQLIEGNSLTKEQTRECVLEIMSGTVSDIQISAFLTALRIKGETTAEIAGAAQAMREKATKIQTRHNNVIDTCGTGGDGIGTFNISTVAAIISSAAGAKVAKHGNRAISSKCGSADVLKALGVNIDMPKERVEKSLDEIGIGFLFAPKLHEAMKYAMPVRRELGFRTIFNTLGPLTNPAGAKRQVLGVYKQILTDTLASVLQDLGTERALVVHGLDGMDEISTIGETKITEIKNGQIDSYLLHPDTLDIERVSLNEILGGDVEKNVSIVNHILSGKKGAVRDIALLNAAAALYVSEITSSLKEGIALAADAVDSGNAKQKLNDLIAFSYS
ncbi:MAG: anthranilate phosphoribosyltransferase [Bacteroidetes bacterium]|nr:anthranilate phosphoribosyltransferase [Bacteroidota bacterium]